MVIGYNIKIPLSLQSADGSWAITTGYDENVKQNLKMIILTSKGEKLSDRNFGCGLKEFLFENPTEELKGEIVNRIQTQVETYAPYVEIEDIEIVIFDEAQTLQVLMQYTIPATNSTQETTFEVTS